MADGREGPELRFHARRGAGNAPPGCVVVLGGIFLTVLVASVMIERGGAKPGFTDLGTFFGSVGVFLVTAAIWTYTRPGRYIPRRQAGPETWTAYPWNPEGARDETGERALAYLKRSLLLALFLVPASAGALVAWKQARFATVFVVGGDIALVCTFARAFFLLLRFRRFGGTRFHFARFPFFLGETLEGRVTWDRPLPKAERITIMLRCVEETTVPGQKSSRDVARLAWSSEIRPAPNDLALDGRELRVRIDLPQAVPSTDFSSEYPEYWELLVKAELVGVDYSAVFLVPVYAKPGA